ncbi:ester cyclase [Haloarculaceae archaeon H-GB2-1]|nr:ester cyclase [Haloarculaceae archaeon H-GB1-1]MEA5409469.1 ester cyclase [Haloarculaceae archaeon H-GB2-1]
MTDARTPETLAQHLFDALNEEDEDAFFDVFAPDARIYNAGDGTDVETLWEAELAMFEAFPDHEHTTDDVVAGAESVAVRFTFSGTHEGDYDGIEPTGRTVSVSGMCTVDCDGDEITEWRVLPDNLDFYRQLGAVESPYEHRYEAFR